MARTSRASKSSALLLTLALVLAACGTDEEPDDTTEPDDAEETDPDDDSEDAQPDDDIALPDSDRCDETIGVTDDTITVTAISDLSGPISQLGGIDHAAAFEARFDAVNEAGGIDGYTIEVDTRDGQYDPVETATQYEQARTESALIGDVLTSGGMSAIAGDVADDCMIAFMGAPNGFLAQQYATTFSPTTTYGHEILNTVEWVTEDEEAGDDINWALAYQGDAMGESIREAAEFAAEQLGFEFVDEVTFGPADEDLTAQAQSLLAADADYVIYGGLPGQLASLSATAHAQDSDMQFITQTGGWTPSILETPAGPAIEANVLVSTSLGAWGEDEPGLATMREDVETHADVAPGQPVLTGYATAMVVEEVLRTAVDSGDLTLGGIYRAAMSTGFDPEGILPPLEFGQFADEPRIPSHESRVLRPNADVEGGVEPLTDYFESDLSAEYVEPAI